jgi:hypothetical protein
MLVWVHNSVAGATLTRVCVVAGGTPYRPEGFSAIQPGDVSSRIEVLPAASGQRGVIYFEVGGAATTLAFVTDDIFEVVPGARLVVTIDDRTPAHNAPVEVEGAVKRLEKP